MSKIWKKLKSIFDYIRNTTLLLRFCDEQQPPILDDVCGGTPHNGIYPVIPHEGVGAGTGRMPGLPSHDMARVCLRPRLVLTMRIFLSHSVFRWLIEKSFNT